MTIALFTAEFRTPIATTAMRRPFETAPGSYWRSVELLRAARLLRRGARLRAADGVALGMNCAEPPPASLEPQVNP